MQFKQQVQKQQLLSIESFQAGEGDFRGAIDALGDGLNDLVNRVLADDGTKQQSQHILQVKQLVQMY